MASSATSLIPKQSSRLEQGTSSAAVSVVGNESSVPWYKSACFRIFLGLLGLGVLLCILIFLTCMLVKMDYGKNPPTVSPTLAPTPITASTTRWRFPSTSSPKPTDIVKTTIDGGSLTLPAIVFTHRRTLVRTPTSEKPQTSPTASSSERASPTPSTLSPSPPTDSMKTLLDDGDLQLPDLIFKHRDPVVVDDDSHDLIHRSRNLKV